MGKASGRMMSQLLMVVLAFQAGLQPLLIKTCIDDQVQRASVVVATEVAKILLCSATIALGGRVRAIRKEWSLGSSLSTAAFPAMCYALQNMLCQAAYQHLDSVTYNVLNQTKTLSAALCCYLIMGRRQSKPQLLALFLLFVAALSLNGGVGSGGWDRADHLGRTALTIGVPAVLSASFLSGLGGAITQRTLQTHGRDSSLLSMELAAFGVVTLLFSRLLQGGSGLAGFFDGWTPLTAVPVLTSALGGIVVGQVTKHAGSVKKGFALIAGIILTAVLQSLFEKDHPLSAHHVVAAALTGLGIALHANFPPETAAAAAAAPGKKKD